jgi:hypothetical protein
VERDRIRLPAADTDAGGGTVRQPKGRVTSRPGPMSPVSEQARSRGIREEFYDPEGERYGIPTYPWRSAPGGYATKRQLRAEGLSPGGQEIAGQLVWWHGGRGRGSRGERIRRVAWLYEISRAVPVRPMSEAKARAVRSALLARMTCPSPPAGCGRIVDYCLSKNLGVCTECAIGQGLL